MMGHESLLEWVSGSRVTVSDLLPAGTGGAMLVSAAECRYASLFRS